MMTVAVVSAAKRPNSTCKRGCGVDSTNSSRPSSSSADQRLAWVTAKAIKQQRQEHEERTQDGGIGGDIAAADLSEQIFQER